MIYYIAHLPAFIPLILIISYAIISDFLDGFIARKTDNTSTIGKLLDPIADAMLILSTLITMTIYNLLPAWFCLLNLIRYALLMGIALPKLNHPEYQLESNLLGKVSVTITTITLSIHLLFPGSPNWLKVFSLTLSSIFLCLSLYQYYETFNQTSKRQKQHI